MKKIIILTTLLITTIAVSPAYSLQKNPFVPKLPEKEIVKPVKEIKKPEKPIVQRPRIPPRNRQPQIVEKPVIPKEIKPPALSITGLVWNSDRPQAIVNEQVVDIGDEIDSVKIVAIRKDSINISFEGKTFIIEP